MAYTLGIDLGTSRTAAAVWRNGQVAVVPLSDHASTMPSLLFFREEGTPLLGDAAKRRAAESPAMVASEFKRRFGDQTPLVFGADSYTAEQLTAMLLGHVVEFVAAREGGQPDLVVVAHPANWGTYRRQRLRSEAARIGLTTARLVAEPDAAAVHYAAATPSLAVGGLLAVYDLGGGTFDASVLRRVEGGFAQVGEPKGIERLGGVDFDREITDLVIERAGLGDDQLAAADPTTIWRLRDDCRQAKEALSDDERAVVNVSVGDLRATVVVTRADFESLIRPSLVETLRCVRTVILDSGAKADEVGAILLAGGSSRIPLISEMLAAEFPIPLVLSSHPKECVALGAARIGAPQPSAVPTSWAAGRSTEQSPGASVAPRTPPGPTPAPFGAVSGPPAHSPAVRAPFPTSTVPLQPVPAARPTPPAPPRSQVARQSPTPIRPKRRGGSVAAVLVAALLAGGGVAAALLLRDRSEPAVSTAAAPAGDRPASTNPAPAVQAPLAQSPAVQPQAAQSPAVTRQLTGDEAELTYRAYVDLLARKQLDQAWAMLTPTYQAKHETATKTAEGLFTDLWSHARFFTIDAVRQLGGTADLQRIEVDQRIGRRDGKTSIETVQVTIISRDGIVQIDGYSVLSARAV